MDAKKPKNRDEKRKFFRQENYINVNNTSFKLDSTFPRTLNLDEFAQSRANELSHFINIVKEKYRMKDIPHKIPKHMRRRTTSHNYYRIPFKHRYQFVHLRVKDPKSNTAGNRSRCRKHLRKPHTMLKEFTKRSNKCKWLQTHIWHAKRMKMKEIWGYKLAYQRSDKSLRCIYKFAKEDCCIYDKSYYDIVEVTNSKDKLKQFVKSDDSLRGITQASFNMPDGEYYIPVDMICCPNEDKAWLITHPEDTDRVCKIIGSQACIMKNKCYFELYGKKAIETLMRVLYPLNISNKQIQQYLTDARGDMSILPNNVILAFDIDTPNSEFRMNERIINQLFTQQCVQNKCVASNPNPSNYIHYPTNMQETMLWTQPSADMPVNLETSRSKISHKKKLKQSIKSYSEKLTPNFQYQAQNINCDQQICKNHKTGVIIVVEKSTSTIGSRIKILTNDGYQLWRRFIYANAKAIALRELISIYHEQEKIFYPLEDVKARSYQQTNKDNALQKMLEYYRKPPQKRIDFYKNHVEFPFCPVWSECCKSVSELIQVRIMAPNRLPQSGAAIYLSSNICNDKPLQNMNFNSDFEIFTGKSKNELYGNIRHHKERETRKRKLINEILGKGKDGIMYDCTAKKEEECKEEAKANCIKYFDENYKLRIKGQIPIGFVMHGGYSYCKGKGYGIGYIRKDAIKASTIKVYIQNYTRQVEAQAANT